MISQTENSTDSIDAVAYAGGYWRKEPVVTKEMKFDMELRDITSSLNRLRNYIESVDRNHNREINILYRLIEERTLILSDVDEIYNDYC